jgi:hypothetical protein
MSLCIMSKSNIVIVIMLNVNIMNVIRLNVVMTKVVAEPAHQVCFLTKRHLVTRRLADCCSTVAEMQKALAFKKILKKCLQMDNKETNYDQGDQKTLKNLPKFLKK